MPTGDGLLARVHPPLGSLTPGQARAVAEGARRHGNGHVDVTARANLQVRGVTEASRAPLARLLEAAGLGDVRADGGPQRLTLTAPLAGSEPGALIDVPRLAAAIEAAGRGVTGLPAKTLVAVAGRPGMDVPDADLVVRASAPGRIAVGLAGSEETLACREADGPAVLAHMLAAFARSGRRRVRDLAAGERADMLAAASPLPCPTPSPAADGMSGADWASRDGASPFAFAPPAGLTRMPEGGAVLVLDAPFGRCTADALDRLADAAAACGSGAIHLSPARGFAWRTGDAAAAARALDALARDFVTRADDPRRAVATCPGATACASGSTATHADAARLAEAFRPLAARGLAAHVSGCAKGCAHPGPAALTLVGRDGAYAVVLDGAAGAASGPALPIEAALERVIRAASCGLGPAFSGTTETDP